MIRRRYLRHLTLDTGDQRDSYRDEVAGGVVAMLRPLLERAVRGERVPIPGADPPGCTLSGGVGRARALMVTVAGPDYAGVAHPPIVEITVAPSSLAGAHLWRERDDRAPTAPWCAVRLLPGLAVYPQAASWLGGFERCLAWSWIDN